MTDNQQRDRDRDIEGRSSFVRSLMEAQASLEAARRGGGGAAAGPGGAHVGVGAAGAALEVLAHMDSAASEGGSTSVLLNRVDEYWGPGGSEGGSNTGLNTAAATIGSGGGIGEGYSDEEQVREPRRTPHTRPPPPKPRRGRPPPPPGPIEPPMPLPRKGAASIDDKYTAAWRAVPDLCTGEVVALRGQENSAGNTNDGLNLPSSVLIERAVGVGDDEHLVRCRNCTRGLRVHKMASMVRCQVCNSVSPATSLR